MKEEKINTLYRLLDCNNAKIAHAAGYSASAITRLRNGSRSYKPTSRPVLRFAEGIYIYAEMTGTLRPLCELCGAENETREEVISALAVWFFEEQPIGGSAIHPVVTEHLRTIKEKQKRFLGEKLGSVMEILRISNLRLAALVNVDPSTISRFRSGVRRPKPPMDQLLVSALLKIAKTHNTENELAKLCGVSAEVFNEKLFFAWLFQSDAENPDYSFSPIDTLLDSIERFPIQEPSSAKLPDPHCFVTDEILNNTETTYWGIEGLREAVIRFLGEKPVPDEDKLFLYSDQGLEWMVGDPEFQAKWSSLMASCVYAGVQISIIHNTDRSLSEMVAAVQSWLPLYLSGRIKSYICQLGADTRFSKTIFLRADKSCILGSALRGNEKMGRYEYLTENRVLDAAASDFDSLLAHSVPLVKLHFDNGTASFDAYQEDKNIRLLLPAPSLGTIPKITLHQIMERNGLTKTEQAKIENARAFHYEWLQKKLAAGKVSEFFTLPSDEALFHGAAPVNLPPSVCDRDLYYTPEEFASHAGALMEQFKNNQNYELILLPEQPFDRIQIITADNLTTVTRIGSPSIDFVFSEPRMTAAFQEYFTILEQQYKTDRKNTLDRLMSFT